MDKPQDDVRRGGGGASRLSSRQIINKQSGHNNLFSGSDGGEDLLVPLEKPKKQRLVKKLSAVNRASSSKEEDFEMGCDMSDREIEFPSQSHSSICTTGKRFKFFYDCKGIDHASVPRKLRSAMKKRNCESLSPPLPDSKKLNRTIGLGVESPPKKDGLKKSKLSMKQGSSDWSTKHAAGPITKDEEEVVETLYALAGMFHDNDSNNEERKLETAPLEAKLAALPDCKESPTPALEGSAVTKEDISLTCPFRTTENISPSSNVENSMKETAGVISLNEPGVQEPPNLNDGKIFIVKSESCVPQVNLYDMISSLPKTEHNDDKPSCDPVRIHLLPELNLDSGLKQSSQKDTSLLDRKPELVLGATSIGAELVQQDMVMEPRNKGLWPGLSPMALHGAGSHGPLHSSSAKIPAWLDTAMSASEPCSLENSFSTGKVSKGDSDRRSLKRCAAHVYISRVIRDLQLPENKEKSYLQPDPLRTARDRQEQGIVMAINDFDRAKKGVNEVISGNNLGSSTSGRNSSDVRNSILHQHNSLHEDQQNAAASRVNALQKQGFDFLSLSAEGGGAAEATKSFNRTGNQGIAPSSHFQLPYLHSLAQHQRFMTHVMPQPQTRYTSSPYHDQLSTSTSASSHQVQLQLPPYISSPFNGPPHASSTFSTKQQQQQFWAAQLAAQYRAAGTSSTGMNQIPSWVNGRHNPTHSASAQEVFGPKYSPISQQQQQPQLVSLTSSLPPSRVKRQDHHLPLVYEETEGGFWTGGGAFPLQLLCNERL